MELETLKQNWASLNERLEKSEAMTQSLIKRSINERGQSAIDRLRKYDMVCIVIQSAYILLFVLIAVLVYGENYDALLERPAAFWGGAMMLFALIACLIATPTDIYRRSLLGKIDFSKDMRSNILLANRYKMAFNIQQSIEAVFLVVVLVMCSLFYLEMDAPMDAWIVVIAWWTLCITVGAVCALKYFKNMRSVTGCLTELKALNDEDEA